ncbi:MAG: signal peptidase II [Azoarcus sp.]|jgi:signal peptidase II|nr:signal peptidase II [Azoarcus sp.]
MCKQPAWRALMPWWCLIVGVVALDQTSKLAVLDGLARGDRIMVTSFFDLVLTFNTGAAFSFLAEHSGWQRWFFTVFAVIVSGWLVALMVQHRHERILVTGFAFVIGGALGNVIDRLIHGAVVDFLYFHAGRHGWPAFNLADSAITLGVVLMLLAQWRARPQTPSSEHCT